LDYWLIFVSLKAILLRFGFRLHLGYTWPFANSSLFLLRSHWPSAPWPPGDIDTANHNRTVIPLTPAPFPVAPLPLDWPIILSPHSFSTSRTRNNLTAFSQPSVQKKQLLSNRNSSLDLLSGYSNGVSNPG
jgi:hypothetical protein